MENLNDKIRQNCWDKALDAFGFTYIYSKRITGINFLLNWTKVLGVLIPVFLGGITASYYTNSSVMTLALFFTAPLAIAQLGLSTALIVLGSDRKLTDYTEKAVGYSLLNSEFEHLAKFPDTDYNSYSKKYEILLERERALSKGNSNLKDKELRKGMRAGLRNYRRECVGCKTTPTSMTSTKCDVCGNF